MRAINNHTTNFDPAGWSDIDASLIERKFPWIETSGGFVQLPVN